MSTRFFFVRHGRTEADDAVSPRGRDELHSLKQKLAAAGFEPSGTAFHSPAGRCLDTATLLAPHCQPCPCPFLRRFGEVRELYPYADQTLKLIDMLLPKEEADTLVVSHSCFPAVLALRLIERRGAAVDWLAVPQELSSLSHGSGVLVCGATFFLLTP